MNRLSALLRHRLIAAAALIMPLCAAAPADAQVIDCNRLAAQIAAAGRSGGGQFSAAAQKQRAELARTSAYASSLGCDRPNFFLFGERPPQCAGINAQIARMQANLQSLSQAAAYGGNGSRAMLQQRFDMYCRGGDGSDGGRGFFERLFNPDGQERMQERAPEETISPPEEEENRTARGGSQAVCVRTCDGGYFPMAVSARRRDLSDLQDLCSALCPGTEAKLYTRVPGREISSAVSVNGNAYSDLPNALKFEKTFDKTCTCKPADKSWVEALANAERLLGEEKGDILVTPEKAEELSRIAGPGARRDKSRKFDPNAIAKAVGGTAPADAQNGRDALERQKKSADEATASDAAAAANAPTASTESSGIGRSGAEKDRLVGTDEGVRADEAGPEGGRRKIRVIPQ